MAAAILDQCAVVPCDRSLDRGVSALHHDHDLDSRPKSAPGYFRYDSGRGLRLLPGRAGVGVCVPGDVRRRRTLIPVCIVNLFPHLRRG